MAQLTEQEMEDAQLLDRWLALPPGWSPEKQAVHDRVRARIKARGIIRHAGREYRVSDEDRSFTSCIERYSKVPVHRTHERVIGRAHDLTTPDAKAPVRGRLHGRRSG